MDYTAAISFFEPDVPYLLATHVNADCDGIGGLLALREMLVRKKRVCRLVVSDETLNPKFAFLPGFEHIELYQSLADRPSFDRAVFVDTPTLDPQRVGDVCLPARSARQHDDYRSSRGAEAAWRRPHHRQRGQFRQ